MASKDTEMLVKIEALTTLIESIREDTELDAFERDSWLIAIAGTALDSVNPELRKTFFENFEEIRAKVHNHVKHS